MNNNEDNVMCIMDICKQSRDLELKFRECLLSIVDSIFLGLSSNYKESRFVELNKQIYGIRNVFDFRCYKNKNTIEIRILSEYTHDIYMRYNPHVALLEEYSSYGFDEEYKVVIETKNDLVQGIIARIEKELC